MPDRPKPIDREASFELHELFFSSTDRRGVIRDGNDVFVRISGYPMERLVGSPHNIIRHPDMPRSVFQLLWEYIQSGKRCVAYVKNMAADGRYYWVCALVAPICGGYLSIRLKPSSPLFDTIRSLYVEMLQAEQTAQTQGQTRPQMMAAGRARLEQAVRQLGYDDYSGLMDTMLLTEVLSRRSRLAGRGHSVEVHPHCRGLRQQMRMLLDQVEGLLGLQKTIREQTTFVQKLGGELQRLSINAQIRAAGLNHQGAALQVVAEQMTRSAALIGSATEALGSQMAGMNELLNSVAARFAIGDLSVEMMSQFLSESSCGSVRSRLDELAEVVQSNIDDACQAAGESTAGLGELYRRLDAFVKEIRTLEILHVTGKVESVRADEGRRVSLVFEEVNQTTTKARSEMARLIDRIEQVQLRLPDRQGIHHDLQKLQALAQAA